MDRLGFVEKMDSPGAYQVYLALNLALPRLGMLPGTKYSPPPVVDSILKWMLYNSTAAPRDKDEGVTLADLVDSQLALGPLYDKLEAQVNRDSDEFKKALDEYTVASKALTWQYSTAYSNGQSRR